MQPIANLSSGTPSERRDRVTGALRELHARYADERGGRLADYIPELDKADPDTFAIALVTTRGEVFSVGDDDARFTIQSVSKPFVHGLALDDAGRERVLEKVGVEPTGDPFNALIKLDAYNRPHNPMVNTGAIAMTGLIESKGGTDRLDHLLDMFGAYIGQRPEIDEAVFESERSTGHRNRAIAHLLLHFGVLERDVEATLDLYFRQCSVLVTAADVAMMAATLANRGVHPVTGQRATRGVYTRDILSVMYACGMYNYAGEWAYTVGLPAKSGVSGAVMVVVPGQFGLCVYSPPVDDRGNSVRGIRVCEDLSHNAGMHVFDAWFESGALLDRIDDHATDDIARRFEAKGDTDERGLDPAQRGLTDSEPFALEYDETEGGSPDA